MTDKKILNNKNLIHPVAAAAMGAVVGAAGGIAAAKYLSHPDNQKIVGDKFNQLKVEAKKRWEDISKNNSTAQLLDNSITGDAKKTQKAGVKKID